MLLSLLIVTQAGPSKALTPTQCFERCLQLLTAAAGQKKVVPHRPILGCYWAFGRPTHVSRQAGRGAVFFSVNLSTSRPNKRETATAIGLVPLEPADLPVSDPAYRWVLGTGGPFKLLMANTDKTENIRTYLYGVRLATIRHWNDRQLTSALVAIARNPAQPHFGR